MPQTRQLVAIMFTDIVGYTSMMQRDEQLAVAAVRRHQQVLEDCVAQHSGEVLQYYGDGSLSVFPSSYEALRCAADVQALLQQDPMVPLRIGIHLGEILREDGKFYGDAVNVASRIQSQGVANSVLFSADIHDTIRNKTHFSTVSLGKLEFKNVSRPIEVFALTNKGLAVPTKEELQQAAGKKGLSSALRYGILAAGFLLLAVIGFLIYKKMNPGKSSQTVSTIPSSKSIAVLPFVDMSSEKNQEWFADGLTEEILNSLSHLKELKVMSRTSSFTYKNRNLPIQQIADSLGVANIVEGSVRKFGEQVKITVQLIRANDGNHIWSQTYEKPFSDIFRVQEDIATNIAQSLNIYLDDATRNKMFATGTGNPEAFENYLKGYNKFTAAHKSPDDKRTIEQLQDANIYFKKALTLDPEYGVAYYCYADIFGHILLADPSAKTNSYYDSLKYYTEMAVQKTPDSALKKFFRVEQIFQSDNWTDLRTAVEDFLKDNDRVRVAEVTSLGWVSAFRITGHSDELIGIATEVAKKDPMNSLHLQRWYTAMVKGNFADAKKMFLEYRNVAGGPRMGDSIFLKYFDFLQQKQKDSAITLLQFVFPVQKNISRMAFLSPNEHFSLVNIWDTDEYNRVLTEIDNQKLGHMKLASIYLQLAHLRKNVINLQYTPHFARRLLEAGINLE